MIDLFTDGEIRRARAILRKAGAGSAHVQLMEYVVTAEVMERINRQTGQENDRSYLAYRLEFVADIGSRE